MAQASRGEQTSLSCEPGDQSNDPYYAYQDPSAYQTPQDFPSYDQQPGSDAYQGQQYTSPSYQDQQAPVQKQRQRAQPDPLSRILSGIPGFDQIVNGTNTRQGLPPDRTRGSRQDNFLNRVCLQRHHTIQRKRRLRRTGGDPSTASGKHVQQLRL